MEENKEIKRSSPKRIVFEVSEDLHREIKIRAANRNISIRTYIIRALAQVIKTEQQYE